MSPGRDRRCTGRAPGATPRLHARALPATLGACALPALLATTQGCERPVPEALFMVIYWSGSLGVAPVALWCALALEGALRRRALASVLMRHPTSLLTLVGCAASPPPAAVTPSRT